MKKFSFACTAAVLILSCVGHASAQIIDFYYDSAAGGKTFTYIQPFALTTFDSTGLNSIFSATLTSTKPGQNTSASINTSVFLSNSTIAGFVPVEVVNQDLSLNMSTTTSQTSTALTPDYPVQFLAGPSGTFDEIIVDVAATISPNGIISFTGTTQLVPEPSTWALFAGGLGLLAFLGRRRLSMA